jgi:hypothetical protein
MRINTNFFPAQFNLSSLNGSNGVTFNGIGTNDASGSSVSSAGDVNGDGIDDLLIGAPSADSGTGVTYLVFGHNKHWFSPFSLNSLNGSSGVVFDAFKIGGDIGSSVSSAGDVNGDGIADLLIGAPSANRADSNAGATYLVFGHNEIWQSPFHFSQLNGTNGVIFEGATMNENSGYSVSSAGDVNGDGKTDLLIGAPFANSNTGSTYLVFGNNALWSSPFNLSALNGINGVTFEGVTISENSGYSVSSAGDTNSDGFDDMLIGAYGANGGIGATYLIFGHNGQWASPFSLDALNGVNGIIFNGSPESRSGYSVSSAGDINGDGFDDMLIGAYESNKGIGTTYLVFGHNGEWISPVSLGALNGTNGVIFNGVNASDYTGSSVSSAGDTNDDGFDDMLIGAYGANEGAGATYLVFGHNREWASPVSLGVLDGTGGIVFNGATSYDQSGFSVGSAGDINGDGLDDILIGAPSANPNSKWEAGSTYLVFGQASDLTRAGINLLKKGYENITNWWQSKQGGTIAQGKELLAREQVAGNLQAFAKVAEKLELVMNQLNPGGITDQNLLGWLKRAIIDHKAEVDRLMQQPVVNKVKVIEFFENIQTVAKDLIALVEDSAEDFDGTSLSYVTSMLENLNEQLIELAKEPMLASQAIEIHLESSEFSSAFDSQVEMPIALSTNIGKMVTNVTSLLAGNASGVFKIGD